MVCKPAEGATLVVSDPDKRSRIDGARMPSIRFLAVPGPTEEFLPVDFIAKGAQSIVLQEIVV